MVQKIDSDVLKDRIQSYVLAGNRAFALKEIRKYSKHTQLASFDQRENVFRWLFDLGEFKAGFFTFVPKEMKLGALSTSEESGQKLFYCCVYLNMMGASDYALHMADKIEVNTATEYRLKGGIYLLNGHYLQAINHYARSMQLDSEENIIRQNYRAFFNIIVAHIYLKNFDEARQWMERLNKYADKYLHVKQKLLELEMFIAYYQRDLERAVSFRHQIEKLFADHPQKLPTNGSVQFEGLKMLVSAALNNRQAFEIDFLNYRSCQKKLIQNGFIKIEGYFFMMSHLYHHEFISDQDKILLESHPLSFPKFHQVPINKRNSLGDEARAIIRIYSEQNEFHYQGSTIFGIGKEEELIAILVRCGHMGINSAGLISLLWKDQFFSYFQSINRLETLISRVRKHYNLSIERNKDIIKLSNEELTKIYISWDKTNPYPSIFNSKQQVSRKEFQDYYQLSKSRSCSIISELIESGLIQQTKDGNNVHYSKNSEYTINQ